MRSSKLKKTPFALALERIINDQQLTETTTASVVTGMVESDNQMSPEIETPKTFAGTKGFLENLGMIEKSFLDSAEATKQTEEVTSINTEASEEQQSDTPQMFAEVLDMSTLHFQNQVVCTETNEEQQSDIPRVERIKKNIKKMREQNKDQSEYIEILQDIIEELMVENEQLTSLDVEKPKVIESQTELIEKLKAQLEKASQTDRAQEEHIIDLSFKLQTARVQQDEVSSLRAKNAEYEATIEGQKKTIQLLTEQLANINGVLKSQQETIFRLSMSESRAPPVAAPPVAAPPIVAPTVPISGAPPPPPLPLSKDAPPPPPPMSANWKPKEAPITATNQSNENTIQEKSKQTVRGIGIPSAGYQDELNQRIALRRQKIEKEENTVKNTAKEEIKPDEQKEVRIHDTVEEMKVQKEKLEKNQKEAESKLKTMTDELKKAELEVKEKTDLMNQHQSDTDEFKTAKNALDDAQKALKRLQKDFDKVKKDAGTTTQNILISSTLMKQRLRIEGGGESCDWT